MSESMPNALGTADPLAPVRYLDVVLVVLAAPFAILLGAPVLGYLVGAGVWIVQRVLEAALVCLVAYTVHLATALILRPLERNPNQT